MILFIDNYDSFVFNLRRYVVQLGQETEVVRHDDPRLANDLADHYKAIVISPGPKAPQDAGYCLDVVRRESGRLPILGVCLGHQVIFEAFGGAIRRARQPVHGKYSWVTLESSRLFQGIASPARFARYHSLVGEPTTTPDTLKVTASAADGEVMAVEHRRHLTFGVQFHPESILSLDGHRLLANFLQIAGLGTHQELPPSDLFDPGQIDGPVDRKTSEFQLDGDPEHYVALPTSKPASVPNDT